MGGWLWWYCIVGDNLVHNFQETTLMVRIASFMVKTMKQELKVNDTLLQCSNTLVSSIFSEFSNLQWVRT
jgi:hypothetical protein